MRIANLVALLVVISIMSLAGQVAAGCAPDSIWMRSYGVGGEFFMAVQNTPDRGLIMGGMTSTYGAGDSDFWLVKTDAYGDAMWMRTYGTAGEEDLHDLRAVPAGGYIMAGSRRAELSSNTDIWVVRTDENGDTLWTWTYGDPVEADWAGSVQPMANGHFAVVATRYSGGNSDIALYMLDSDGNPYDVETFGGLGDDVAMAIRQTSDGGFIIAGWTNSYSIGDHDVYLIKTDDTGALDWFRTYGGGSGDEGRDAIITSDGGYVIVGNTSSFGSGGGDFYIVKTNSAGDTLWTRAVGGTNWERADAVIEATDGTIAVVGPTESFGPGSSAINLVALDGYGNVHCTQTYGTDGRDDATSLVETPDQGVVIAGAVDPAETFDWSGLVLRVYGQAPIIHSIVDVPYDQGRNARLVWGRSSHDREDGSPEITGYAIYRKYDWAASRDHVDGNDFARLAYPPGDWDYVTTVPARYEDVYSTIVPTLCDSSVSYGICWSFFFVSAVTAEPGFYFDSPPDSGYSVDNLSPSPPANLHMATATDLAWDEAPEEDFDYFTVYGSDDPDFTGSVMVGYTIDTGYDVSAEAYTYYHVTATDFAGNEGGPSTVENVYAGLPDSKPVVFALRQNKPNPFHQGTSIAFDMPVASRVTLEVVSVGGRVVRTLVSDNMPAGRHSVSWDGRDAEGQQVGPSIYFIRMRAGDFSATRKMMALK